MDERLSTGLDALDRQLGSDTGDDEEDEDIGGGIPAGSLVALEVPVGAMYDPLVWALLGEQSSVYLSTLRSDDAVTDDLRSVGPGQEYQVHHVGLNDPVRSVSGVIELVDWQAYIVVDTANALERTGDGERYVNFLNELKKHLQSTGSVGVLVSTKTDAVPNCREYTLTIADVVWEIETRIRRATVEHFLHVRKFRGGDLPEDMIKLDLGETVSVDTSRDIA